MSEARIVDSLEFELKLSPSKVMVDEDGQYFVSKYEPLFITVNLNPDVTKEMPKNSIIEKCLEDAAQAFLMGLLESAKK